MLSATRMSGELPRVYLVRHGETAWTMSGQHTGRTDIALTPRGEREARGLRGRLRGVTFATVLTSPLQRARRTGELAGFAECMQADADLMEWDYGAYEGQRSSDIRVERPGWDLFEDGCPDGEALEDVSRRAERIIARVRARDGDVLVFAHMEILRIVAARWIAQPAREARRLYLETASVSVLGYDHDVDQPVLRLWNAGGSHGAALTPPGRTTRERP